MALPPLTPDLPKKVPANLLWGIYWISLFCISTLHGWVPMPAWQLASTANLIIICIL